MLLGCCCTSQRQGRRSRGRRCLPCCAAAFLAPCTCQAALSQLFAHLAPAPPRRYKRPVWLTEFACPSGAAAASRKATDNEKHLAAAAKWMDGKNWIER